MTKALPEKTSEFAYDKILPAENTQNNNLEAWANLYFRFHVIGSSKHTIRAKKNDLSKFLSYLENIGGGPPRSGETRSGETRSGETRSGETRSGETRGTHPDNWTPSVTKSFQRHLLAPSITSEEGLRATSVNRIMATLSHFSRWLIEQRPLLAGDPFQGVRTVTVDSPAWNGLDVNTVTRLKMACDQRLKICTRKNQNPLMEGAIFYVLLGTGLRESELIELTIGQYHHRGFHQVKRKGNKVTRKVSVPSEAKEWLDRYLESRGKVSDSDRLFVSRSGKPLHATDIYRAIQRIADQASVGLDTPIKLSPHMLRHTFLKKVSDKHGVHVAQEMSGNVGIREVFRYTKPSQDEMDRIAEEIS